MCSVNAVMLVVLLLLSVGVEVCSCMHGSCMRGPRKLPARGPALQPSTRHVSVHVDSAERRGADGNNAMA